MRSTAVPPSNDAQMRSPSFVLAESDRAFLHADENRGIRLLMEYQKVEQALQAAGVRSTIVAFGSARTPSPEAAAAMAASARTPEEKNRALQAASWSRRYEIARAFGRIASERGGAKGEGWLENVVATGGAGGIMEAASRGAFEVGAPSIGFNIRLPREQEPNPYTRPDLTFLFHYFSMRKMHLAVRAAALVIFPGGFGTLDEAFEILTLRHTGIGCPGPIVFVEEAYWRRLIDFDLLVEEGMIAAGDLAQFDFADDPEAIWATLARRGL